MGPIDAELAQRGWVPRAVVLTHAHLDHVLGCAGMVDRHGLHPQLLPEDGPTYARTSGGRDIRVPMDPLPLLYPEPLVEGQTLTFGDLNLEVRHARACPGRVVLIDHQHAVWSGGMCCSGAAWAERTCRVGCRDPGAKH